MKEFIFNVSVDGDKVSMSKKQYYKLVKHVHKLESLADAAIALHELNERKNARGYVNVVDELNTVHLFDDYIKAVKKLLD